MNYQLWSGEVEYLSQSEGDALLNGGYAFRYWNGGVSPLYEGQKAIDFVEQHFDTDTEKFICFGNNPKIFDAYFSMVQGGMVLFKLIGEDYEITYYGEDGVQTFPAFV